MNYTDILITPPIPTAAGTPYEISTVKGDTCYLSLIQWLPPIPSFDESPPHQDTGRPNLYIEEIHDNIASLVTEGSDVVLTIKSSEVVSVHSTVDWAITHTGNLDDKIFKDENENLKSVFNYIDSIHSSTDDTTLTILTGTATILSGTDNVVINIPTVDDTIYTGGVNTYKIGTVTLSNPFTGMDLSPNKSSSHILIEDNSILPVISGHFTLEVKLHPLTAYEKIIDPDTDEQATIVLGVDGDGYTNLKTQVWDDLPLRSIRLTPVDVVGIGGEVLTGGNVYVQAIVQIGRRH